VLLAPATDFFLPPGALDAVRTPVLAWVGTQDLITPPLQTERLKQALEGRAPVDEHIIAGAGHFSFMNQLPPNVTDTLPDRDAFLADLAAAVARFILSPPR
jgi:fermentation-respiration switch protein FrsA (DUF1100 family)